MTVHVDGRYWVVREGAQYYRIYDGPEDIGLVDTLRDAIEFIDIDKREKR